MPNEEFAHIDNLAFWGKAFPIHYILGQDDWLFYARTMDGTLVYYVSEIDWHWMETPHKGNCWNEQTGLNCDGETKVTCRRDCLFMLGYVWAHANELPWRECGNDPVSGEYMGWPQSDDRAFILNSRDNYLPYAPPIQTPGVNQYISGFHSRRPISVSDMRWLIANPARKR